MSDEESSWLDEGLDDLEATGLIVRSAPGARHFRLTPEALALLDVSDDDDPWKHLERLWKLADGRARSVPVRPAPRMTEEEIKRELDILEAAGFIKRFSPGANNFEISPMGAALLQRPDPIGRSWRERLLEAAAEVALPRRNMN